MRSRLVTAALSTAVAAGLTLAAAVPAHAAELIKDGSFEATVFTGAVGDSPDWAEADSQFGSPLCTVAVCGGASGVAPRTGNVFAWFGGQTTANHTSSLSQPVSFSPGGSVLTFWSKFAGPSAPYDATLTVKVDSTTVLTITEPQAAQDSYVQQRVDVSQFAGTTRTLSFAWSGGPTSPSSNLVVDDVSVLPLTAAPTVSSTVPTGPAATTTPKVRGTAESGATVTLFSSSTCTGTPLGSGSAGDFAGTGVQATVPANATTTIYAKASKAGQADSLCSTTSVSYTSDSTAPALPVVTGVTPASPGASTTPSVKGTAETGSTVRLFTTADCSGTPAATGTAAAFAATGLQVSVAASSTTTFKATATDAAGNASGCSTTSATYTQQLSNTPPAAPETTLTKVPGKKVSTTKKKAKVSFAFTSPASGATFQCSLDGAAFTACTSPGTYKLAKGKHTFAVRAVLGGAVDATPATTTVKVKVKRKK